MRIKTLFAPLCLSAIAVVAVFLSQRNDEPINSHHPDDLPGVEFVQPRETEDPLAWRVKPDSVYDGDTLKVFRAGEEKTIRFCGIDAPEMDQPLGERSRDVLHFFVNGEVVDLDLVDEDRYGRTVAEVIYRGQNMNVELVRSGLAWVWEQYARRCPSYKQLMEAQRKAEAEGIGVHNGEHIKPWVWRNQN